MPHLLLNFQITVAQERIAVLDEPFVILLDAQDGSVIDPTFIDLTPLNQGTPKAITSWEEIWISRSNRRPHRQV